MLSSMGDAQAYDWPIEGQDSIFANGSLQPKAKTEGRSPQEFLISYRMTKAAELLKLTTLSVGDIGCAVGYENPLHFSRAFKNVYGVSPREWRNLHK